MSGTYLDRCAKSNIPHQLRIGIGTVGPFLTNRARRRRADAHARRRCYGAGRMAADVEAMSVICEVAFRDRVELDAIEPNQLRALVQETIELHLPADQFAVLKARKNPSATSSRVWSGKLQHERGRDDDPERRGWSQCPVCVPASNGDAPTPAIRRRRS